VTSLRIKLRDPYPRFIAVAELIAKGPSPEWLLRGLATLSEYVSVHASSTNLKKQKTILKRMADHIHYLTQNLPRFGPGAVWSSDIAIALEVLPRIEKQLIEPALRASSRSYVSQKLCAQGVVEAWRLVHGEASPRSERCYKACQAYWKACGGREIGETNDELNWRRRVKDAMAAEKSIAKVIFGAVYKTP
jgi:hypothetical protein